MLFSEKLLQYIWQHKLFNMTDLCTADGEQLQVISAGMANTNAGPDFLNARIKIDNTLLAGNVELHLLASDWIKHHHSKDKKYHNLILHVVYENDSPGGDYLPAHIPVFELKERIPGILLERYRNLMHHNGNILCASQVDLVDNLTWTSWKDRLLIERWQQKTTLFDQWMEETRNSWEEIFYRALARNFGLPVNGDAFAALAYSLPLKLLALHKQNIVQLEALLFGQAGMLNDRFKEEYPQRLRKEYLFLKKKYHLTAMQPHLWKWMRMRPSAFPSIRLAQFAALIHGSSHLFSKILETDDVRLVQDWLNIEASSYWDDHYHLLTKEETSAQGKPQRKKLGKTMIQNILINTICPILAMYDKFQLNHQYLDRALEWMRSLPPENNRYTREWETLHIENDSAWDSQALLHLTRNYCMERRCLDCAVGNKILRAGKESNA